MSAQTKTAADGKADLVAKTQAVTDAQTAWQEAQDEATAKPSTGTTSSATSSGTKASASGSSSPSGSGGSATGDGQYTFVDQDGTVHHGDYAALQAWSAEPNCPSGTPIFDASGTYAGCDQTPRTSTPAEAIAGITAARAAAGLQTVSSCAEVPGSVQGGAGIVHAITWDSWLTSPAHRAAVMASPPAVLSAWNGTSDVGAYVI